MDWRGNCDINNAYAKMAQSVRLTNIFEIKLIAAIIYTFYARIGELRDLPIRDIATICGVLKNCTVCTHLKFRKTLSNN